MVIFGGEKWVVKSIRNEGNLMKIQHTAFEPSIIIPKKNSFGSQTEKCFPVTFIVKMRKFKFLLQTLANNKHKKLHKIKHEKMPSLLIWKKNWMCNDVALLFDRGNFAKRRDWGVFVTLWRRNVLNHVFLQIKLGRLQSRLCDCDVFKKILGCYDSLH